MEADADAGLPVEATSTIIGPSSAGKTCLLVTLSQAMHRLHDRQIRARSGDDGAKAFLKDNSLPTTAIHIERRNDGMKRIQKARERILVDGWVKDGVHQVEATSKVELFEAELQWKMLLKHKMPLRILDGPGGALFPRLGVMHEDENDHMFRYKRELRDALEKSTSIMLVLDGSDANAAGEIASGLRNLATEVKERGHAKIKRIMLCVTKADKRFIEAGRNAKACADRSDPWEFAMKLLTSDGRAALRELAKARHIYARWVSSYGFLPDGSANFDPKTGGFLADDLDASNAARFWEPYGIMESLLFLGDGTPRGAYRLPANV